MKKILLLILILAASASATVLDVRVAAGADDILHVIGDDVYNTTVRVGNDVSVNYNSGMRFQNITIPQGATIDTAILYFTSNDVTTGTTCNATIEGEAVDDAAAFSTLANYTGRARTSANVAWSSIEQWSVTTTTYLSVNFKTVVQEIVNRGGWASGNDLAIFINNNSSSSGAKRVAYNYENSSTLCPLIHIVYSTTAATKRAAIVVENTAAVGVDTMLYNAIVNDLGYTCSYFDIDSIGANAAKYNSAYFDTAADVWILVGSEAGLPSPTAQADSICNAATGVVALGPDFFDETNIGIMDGSDERSPENTGYLLNIGQTHWITKVFPDTIMIDAVTSRIYYNMLMPDSSHNIRSLVIDKDYKSDTSRVLMCVADSGQTVFGTGTPAGSHVVKGRRVYNGLFQSTPTTMDSCQWWTMFERAVAWAAKDTLGTILSRVCFSGKHELDWVSVVENSSGTDSIESYGNYDSNIGFDHDEKHAFAKVKNSAMQRKVGSVYRALDASRAYFNLRYKATSFTDYGGVPPTTWSSGFSFRPIITKWQIERKNCYFSETCPNACWTYAWMDTSATPDVAYAWTSGGAKSTSDTRAIDYDTLVISEATTANTYVTVDLQPDTLGGRMLDTLLNFGWATRMLHYTNSNSGGDNGEMTFFAPTDNNNRTPRLNVLFSSFSTTVPTPTIAIATPQYDDDSVVFVGTYGQTFSPQDVSLSNSQGGALSCATISDNSGGWLYLVASGTNMPITLTIYMIGQQVGYRSATVTITCGDASNSPKTFKVASNLTSASARGATGKTIYR